MSALDVNPKDPNLEKVKEELDKKTLNNTYKNKRQFQRIRAAIKRKKLRK